MKTSTFLKIAAAIAVSPLLLTTMALAGTSVTYSRTQQSDTVLQAIAYMRAGDLEHFQDLLDETARNLYGTPQGMQKLRDILDRLAAGTTSIDTRSERDGTLKGDTLMMISNRVYSVDVLGRHAGNLDPIFNAMVHCIGLSLVDSFGETNKRCRITEISADQHSREGSSASQNVASVRGRNEEKQIGDDIGLSGYPKSTESRAGIGQ